MSVIQFPQNPKFMDQPKIEFFARFTAQIDLWKKRQKTRAAWRETLSDQPCRALQDIGFADRAAFEQELSRPFWTPLSPRKFEDQI